MTGGPPAAVTTAGGARAVLRYARGLRNWRRVAPVLGAFGYAWPVRGGIARLISSADAAALAAAPGTTVQTTDGEQTFTARGSRVWFETVKRYDAPGIGVAPCVTSWKS